MRLKDDRRIRQKLKRLRKRQNPHVRDVRLERQGNRLKRQLRKIKRTEQFEES
ncbi:MAG: hypothetical protein ACFE7E_07915 [Candidatus Hodarchaeota archaeon]